MVRAMASTLHEGLVELFHRDPALAAKLVSGSLGVDLPAWDTARPFSNDVTGRDPAEARADSVTELTFGGAVVAALIVEVQLGTDREKRLTWPAYVANLRRRLGRDVILLVVSPFPRVARWSAKPIPLGHPGYVLTPLVFGPDQVPLVDDPHQARRSPELAVLSALAHGDGPHRESALPALLDGLQVVDGDHVYLYTDVVAALSEAARHCLEALMNLATYEPISPYFRRQRDKALAEGRAEGRAKGRAEGEAKALLAVLAARGIAVTTAARERITACADLDQLDTWLQRAATASTVDDVFA
jgi:hypothetical protein